jgi:hypothetical protein
MATKLFDSPHFGRIISLVFSIILITGGVGSLLDGRLHYRNYWGGAVFAPFAIAIGVFWLALILFRWKRLTETNQRLRGRAARQARQAERTKFPIDDYHRW